MKKRFMLIAALWLMATTAQAGGQEKCDKLNEALSGTYYAVTSGPDSSFEMIYHIEKIEDYLFNVKMAGSSGGILMEQLMKLEVRAEEPPTHSSCYFYSTHIEDSSNHMKLETLLIVDGKIIGAEFYNNEDISFYLSKQRYVTFPSEQ